jgi:hypothetical protein
MNKCVLGVCCFSYMGGQQVYMGYVSDGKRHGHGLLITTARHTMFVGEWKKDTQCGYGVRGDLGMFVCTFCAYLLTTNKYRREVLGRMARW